AATRRQRNVVAVSLAAVLVAASLAGLALWQRETAIENETRAVKEAARAENQAQRAIKSEFQTRAVTDQAQFTESGLLSNTASQLTHNELGGNSGTAMLVALEGLPDLASSDLIQRQRKYPQEAELQLDRSLRNLQEQAVMVGHEDGITSAAFNRDGAWVVTASNDKTVRVWDAATGKQIAGLKGHTGVITCAAWSRDGARVVTASDDKAVRVWEAATGKELVRLAHDKQVNSAAWSPDGRRIVTASDDTTSRIWEAATGKELVRLRGHKDGVR